MQVLLGADTTDQAEQAVLAYTRPHHVCNGLSRGVAEDTVVRLRIFGVFADG